MALGRLESFLRYTSNERVKVSVDAGNDPVGYHGNAAYGVPLPRVPFVFSRRGGANEKFFGATEKNSLSILLHRRRAAPRSNAITITR